VNDIVARFVSHPPDSARRAEHEIATTRIRELALYLNQTLPEGREKSLAITHLEEVMFWSNAGIARQP
jgi:hypothetical protein